MPCGFCILPEILDDVGCPMDNPNEEITDCSECYYYQELED